MTFAEIGQLAGNIPVCVVCDGGNHVRGYADIHKSVVHWSERRMTRTTLYPFLKLCAAVRLNHNRGQSEWLRIYEQATWAQKFALTVLHRRIGASTRDRTRVLFLTRTLTTSDITPNVYAWCRKVRS